MPDCCIILGKPDDRVNHIDYATTLFAFTWPVDKAQIHGAHLQTPSFMRGKRELSLEEVVMSKRLSEVHIYVEHMIGLLKQIYAKYYKVLYHFV